MKIQPIKAAHPIYEDIYSQVNKSGKPKMVTAPVPNNCDTDSAALERLSQLLTTTTASEVSADLIALHDQHDKEAPMASQEESLGEAGTNSTTSEATDPNKSNVFQELDDAFTTLDQELDDHAASDANKNIDNNGIQTQDSNVGVASEATTNYANNDEPNNKSGLIVIAPTAI